MEIFKLVMTKKADLVNVEVFADALEAKLGNAIKLYDMAFVQKFGNEQVGSISVPAYKYIGDAEVVAEGVAIDPVKLSQTAEQLTLHKVAKAVNITDEALKGGFGNPVGEAENQLVQSVANAIDADMFAQLAGVLQTSTSASINAGAILSATAVFGEDQDGDKTVLANPAQMVDIETDKAFIDGKLLGVNVLYSNRVPEGEAYLVKDGALGLYIAQDIDVESARDILTKSTVISADAHFVSHVRDITKVVKITVTP